MVDRRNAEKRKFLNDISRACGGRVRARRSERAPGGQPGTVNL